RREGKTALRDRVLAWVDGVGAAASRSAPLVNALNETRPARVMMEKALGIHRERPLPSYSGETFLEWWRARGGATQPAAGLPGGGAGRVALFVTCAVNFNMPEIGRAAVAVLQKSGCEVALRPQRCF